MVECLHYSLLIAVKGRKDSEVTFIDARTASMDSEKEHFKQSFDNATLDTIMRNGGYDPSSGLRKVVTVSSDRLSDNLLVPQVYTIERPSEAEHPVPLSNLCTLEATLVRDVQYDLPEDTPWISMSDLTPLFTGDMDLSTIRKADCPNNPHFVEGSKDYAFNKEGKFVDSIWDQMDTKKGCHVLEYRECTFIGGNNDIVLYECSVKHEIRVTVVRSTGKPYAVSKGIIAFRPKDGIDANTLAALLRMPIVYRQLIAYEQYCIGFHLNDILVPTDKRVIGDELYRMKKEENVTNELGDKVQAMKTEYINEVRMRKHDMGQYIFELMNIEDLMRYYLNNREENNSFYQQMESLLDNFRTSLSELSEMLDNLSKEKRFGEPEMISIQELFNNLQNRHKADGYKIIFIWDRSIIGMYENNALNKQYLMANEALDAFHEYELKQETEWEMNHRLFLEEMIKEKGLPNTVNCIPEDDLNLSQEQTVIPNGKLLDNLIINSSLYVAPNDFQRLVNNILDNAKRHGFTDSDRRDYEVKIIASIKSERKMLQIDFRNNGNPLPVGMNKMRYGIKGEKAGKTGGTGIGGNYVKSFVEHYGGDYDIFMEDGWTVVRICLPIK